MLKLTPTHLRVATTPFDFAAPPRDPGELATELAATMVAHRGLGLAANQCGLEHRVAVVYGDPQFAMFNPVIVDASEKTELLDEYCMSYPGLIMTVRRPSAIRVRFADARGEVDTHVFRGMTARVVQHEIDHLDGKLFFDGASRVKLERAMKRARKKFGKTYNLGELR